MRKNIHYIWGIIIAAILVTVLANIGLLNRYHKLSQLQVLSPANEEEYIFIFRIGLVSVCSELIILIVFIFFNYSWKDRFLPSSLSPEKRIALIVFYNLILLITFILIDYYVALEVTKTISATSPVSTFLKNYFLNHLSILVIAFISPYVLLRMQKVRAMEQHLMQIKEEKNKAELAALREQISPHFFFNTLSTLSTIVRNDSKEAGLEFIQDISKTYRYTLTAAKVDVVTLKEEVDFLQSYLYVLQKRFGEKMQIDIDIPNQFLATKIPPMSLQLLIENAIQHNVFTQVSPLRIMVYIEKNMLCVTNNLLEQKRVESFGLGLKNLSNRYKLLLHREIIIERSPEKFVVKLPVK